MIGKLLSFLVTLRNNVLMEREEQIDRLQSKVDTLEYQLAVTLAQLELSDKELEVYRKRQSNRYAREDVT